MRSNPMHLCVHFPSRTQQPLLARLWSKCVGAGATISPKPRATRHLILSLVCPSIVQCLVYLKA